MRLTTYYPNGLPHILEERVNGKRRGMIYIYSGTNKLIKKIEYGKYGDCRYIEYWQNYLIYSVYGPSEIDWNADGNIIHLGYVRNYMYDNIHGPYSIEWYDNGQVEVVSYRYWQNNSGTTIIYWHMNGQIRRIDYK